MGARPPRSANQDAEGAGTGTDPPPQPAAARLPTSSIRHPKRMRATWQACRTEAMGEATSPHPVIVGSGRLEDHASASFSKWAAPPCLPPFIGKARTAPFYYDVTHARRAQPHACRPRHARLPTPSHAREAWEAQRVKKLTTVKTTPPARASFLGLAQRRNCAYVWPRPGGSCRCTKREGYTFCTPITVHGQSEPRTPPHRQGKGGEPR